MDSWNIFVIKSNGKYYYSMKGQDFMDKGLASLFRSEKAASAHIRKAIRAYEERKEHRYYKNIPEHAKDIDERLAAWQAAKVVELNVVD